MKKILKFLLIIPIFLIIVVCFKFNIPKNSDDTWEEEKISVGESLASNLTLEEKIGQMLFISYRKPNIDEELTNLLTTLKPGGFIFFSENFQDYDSSLNLINSIKNSASIPLFLGIDEEGGRVDRFKDIKNYTYEKIPDMLSVGNTNDYSYAYNIGTQIGTLLNNFNLNMDFAPVLDIYSNPNNTVIGNRSFGSDPKIVSNMALNLANGLKSTNIIPVYKHFPGHGDTTTDSHYALPVIYKTKEELLNFELKPFKDAIKNDADMIMIGHLALPNVTNDNTPASLSKVIITDLLKNELGYQNLVITDALNMKAITDNYSPKSVIELAINAGVNLLLMPENPENTITTIKELLNENKITEEQINNSVIKILNLKAKYGLI